MGVDGLDEAELGDDGSDELGRGYVEGGGINLYIFWGGGSAKAVGYVPGFSLLDGNAGSVGNGEVEGGGWGSDVKRHVMLTSQAGERVGSDFIGSIAIGGDAVGAGDNHVDAPQAHKMAGDRIADNGYVDAGLCEFPSRQSRALQ